MTLWSVDGSFLGRCWQLSDVRGKGGGCLVELRSVVAARWHIFVDGDVHGSMAAWASMAQLEVEHKAPMMQGHSLHWTRGKLFALRAA